MNRDWSEAAGISLLALNVWHHANTFVLHPAADVDFLEPKLNLLYDITLPSNWSTVSIYNVELMLFVISVEKIITCKFHLMKFHFLSILLSILALWLIIVGEQETFTAR